MCVMPPLLPPGNWAKICSRKNAFGGQTKRGYYVYRSGWTAAGLSPQTFCPQTPFGPETQRDCQEMCESREKYLNTKKMLFKIENIEMDAAQNNGKFKWKNYVFIL